MPIRASRRRIEIDAEVYDMLEREARWLHIPVTSLATLLIRESVGKRFRGLTVEMDQRPLTTGIAGPGAPLDPVGESDDYDPLERDHSLAAIAELRAPVRHPDRGEGDGR